MQKKINIAKPETATLERPACKAGSWLSTENLDFGSIPTIS